MNKFNDINAKQLIDFICSERHLGVDENNLERIGAAIDQRMKILEVQNYEAYKDYLQAHPQEYQSLFDRLFRPKRFFIDETIWALIKPFLVSKFQRRDLNPLRAWVIGCDTGAEAVGVAIALSEVGSDSAAINRMKIFATDSNEDTLSLARQSVFDAKLLTAALSPDLAAKYFTETNGKLLFSSDLRKAIIFGLHDVSSDPAIGRMDLIVCRGVLSYFNPDAQQRIGEILIHALNERGYLILDELERLPASVEASAIAKLPFMYQKPVDRPTSTVRTDQQSQIEESNELLDASFEATPVATMCVDTNGTVVAFNAQARLTFNLFAQDIGKPLQDLEISYRPIELRSLIEAAYKDNRIVMANKVARNNTTFSAQVFDVQIMPLFSGSQHIGASIEYYDRTDMYKLRDDLLTFNQQLQTANEELQSAHEELETTNEELHSTNEELETTNEELQSTNEELETMNEELQSTNTELHFTNAEQRELSTAIARVNAFLESILASVKWAIIVLTADNEIQVWNQRCAELWGLRPDEVRGHDIFGLDIGFPPSSLREPLQKILNGSSLEQFATAAINRRGQSIECEVRVMPLADSPGYIVMIEEVGRQ